MADPLRLGLRATVARLADRAAWAMADMGQFSQAARVYGLALDVTPDPTQRWLSLVNLADVHLVNGEPGKALELLGTAEPQLPVLQFLVHSAKAQALARLGSIGPTLREIDRADRAHAHSAAGKALHTLALHGVKSAVPFAVERLKAAITEFGPDRGHAVASCRGRLAALPN